MKLKNTVEVLFCLLVIFIIGGAALSHQWEWLQGVAIGIGIIRVFDWLAEWNGHLPGWYWRAYHRIVNWRRDLWDKRVRGICCQDLTIETGGYNHWRCGLPRGHEGVHRFRNYIWAGEGHRTEYDPFPCDDCIDVQRKLIELGDMSASSVLCERHIATTRGLRDPDRYPIDTKRQREARIEWEIAHGLARMTEEKKQWMSRRARRRRARAARISSRD